MSADAFVDDLKRQIAESQDWARQLAGEAAEWKYLAIERQKLIHKAAQLASVASDWNLYEVEIDGHMVPIYDLKDQFDAALALFDSERPPPPSQKGGE